METKATLEELKSFLPVVVAKVNEVADKLGLSVDTTGIVHNEFSINGTVVIEGEQHWMPKIFPNETKTFKETPTDDETHFGLKWEVTPTNDFEYWIISLLLRAKQGITPDYGSIRKDCGLPNLIVSLSQ